jgi:hypothetical protein
MEKLKKFSVNPKRGRKQKIVNKKIRGNKCKTNEVIELTSAIQYLH